MRLKSRGWLPRLRKGTSLATVFIYALALGTPTLSAAATSPAEGGLSVVTDPEGAAVYVNGESKGVTPLQLDRIAAGDHRVTVVKDGYLENSRVVRVEAGQTRAVDVQLTSSAGQARYAAQITPGGGGGGGVPTWVWIAAAAGGGTAAYLLLRPTNEPPTATVSVNPSTGLQAATSFAISAQSTDPDGDALTFSWNFGDGTTGSGSSVTKVYNTAGTFTVSVTVSDGEESTNSSGTANVRSMSGTWSGNLGSAAATFFTWNLTQTGTGITGNYFDNTNGSGSVTGSVSAPNNILLVNSNPGFRPGTWRGTLDSAFNRVDGVTDWFVGGSRTFYLIRR
jgi:hypothetical protein